MKIKIGAMLLLTLMALGIVALRPKEALVIPRLPADGPEKPIVVVIPSYNNMEWYKRNLDTLFAQKYDNWIAVYIDDVSTDGTGDAVRAYVAALPPALQQKFIYIRNETNQGGLANLYRVIHACPNHYIIITYDGDDWFAHEYVFATINKVYDSAQVLMTYGQFRFYPSGQVGFCRPYPQHVIENNAYRDYEWLASHLRTFYAGLFKKIPFDALCYPDGQLMRVTWDRGIMLPMLELSGGRWKCLQHDVLMIYNAANSLCDFRVRCVEQEKVRDIIHARPRFTPLSDDELIEMLRADLH